MRLDARITYVKMLTWKNVRLYLRPIPPRP